MFNDNNEDQVKENANFDVNDEDNDNNEAHILKIHQIVAALAPSAKVPAIYNAGEMSLLNLGESWEDYEIPPYLLV